MNATNRNCWANITHSRVGTARAFRRGRRWNGWTWLTPPMISNEGGSWRPPPAFPPANRWQRQSRSRQQRGNAVRADVTTKTVKEIRIDIEKCTGCRACEMACSAFHAKPRYSSVNPARSRIRVVTDETNDEYVPVRAGNYTRTECDGRHFYQLNGKQYSECSFCRASCP